MVLGAAYFDEWTLVGVVVVVVALLDGVFGWDDGGFGGGGHGCFCLFPCRCLVVSSCFFCVSWLFLDRVLVVSSLFFCCFLIVKSIVFLLDEISYPFSTKCLWIFV